MEYLRTELTVPSAVPSTSRQFPFLSTVTQGPISSCSREGPSFRLSLPSASSTRPPQNPSVGPPMLSTAVVPDRTMRSPQERSVPYFSLMGLRSSKALSKFALSGQLSSGLYLILPPSQPYKVKSAASVSTYDNVGIDCLQMHVLLTPRPSERR